MHIRHHYQKSSSNKLSIKINYFLKPDTQKYDKQKVPYSLNSSKIK